MTSFLQHISSRDPDDSDADRARRKQLRDIGEILFNAEAEMRRCNSMFRDIRNGPASRALVSKHLENVLNNLWNVYQSFFELLELDFEIYKGKLGVAVPQQYSEVPPFFRQAVINNEFRICKILESINKFVAENISEWDEIPVAEGIELAEHFLNVRRRATHNRPRFSELKLIRDEQILKDFPSL